MKKMFLPSLFLALIFLPSLAFADAPPPSPIRVEARYDGQKVSDEKFYAALLTCEVNDDWDGFKQVYQSLSGSGNTVEYNALTKLNSISESDPANNCTFAPNYLPFSNFCSKSQCVFNWVLGSFKVAVYVPLLDKVFVSNSIKREYEGYYGRDTVEVYEVDMTSDGKSAIKEMPGQYSDDLEPVVDDTEDSDTDTGSGATIITQQQVAWLSAFWGYVFASFLVTLFLEFVVCLVFILFKKFPWKILGGLMVGNLVSVPLLWAVVTYSYWTLYPGEILVVVFEAWTIKLFGKGKLNWKWCLTISFVMNLISFGFGPFVINFTPL